MEKKTFPALYQSLSWSKHSPPQHEFGVLGHILLHQVVKQSLEDVCEVLQFTVKGYSQQRGYVGPVPGGERPLRLQSVNKLEGRHGEDSITTAYKIVFN